MDQNSSTENRLVLRALVLVIALVTSHFALANEQTGYISENVYVFLHGGPGNQYRILGSVEAGQPVTLLGEQQSNFSKIVDHKGREGWVQTEQLSNEPSFRVLLPKLNQQLKTTQTKYKQASNDLTSLRAELSKAKSDLNKSNHALTQTTQERDKALAKLASLSRDQDYEMWRQGGLIVGIGILLGIIITYLPKPQRRRKERWM